MNAPLAQQYAWMWLFRGTTLNEASLAVVHPGATRLRMGIRRVLAHSSVAVLCGATLRVLRVSRGVCGYLRVTGGVDDCRAVIKGGNSLSGHAWTFQKIIWNFYTITIQSCSKKSTWKCFVYNIAFRQVLCTRLKTLRTSFVWDMKKKNTRSNLSYIYVTLFFWR